MDFYFGINWWSSPFWGQASVHIVGELWGENQLEVSEWACRLNTGDGTCDDMDEDIPSQEDDHNEAFEHIVEDDNANTVDSNIIVIDEDAQSDYLTKNSEKLEATDTIYIDDTAEDSTPLI